MTISRRRLATMVVVLVLPPLATFVYAWSVYSHYKIDVPPRLDDDDPSWDRWNPWLARESKVRDEPDEESW